MSKHTVKFWDKTWKMITPRQAESLRELIDAGVKGVEIDGSWYAISAIAAIEAPEKVKSEVRLELEAPVMTEAQIQARRELVAKTKREMAEKFGWK